MIIEGNYAISDEKFAIVVSQFNQTITDKLCDGAVTTLKKYGVSEDNILIVKVPGAFEIPQAVSRIINNKIANAVIALGAVIKGETAHFDYVAGPTSSSLSSLSLNADIPVIFGVLTTDTVEQALNRAGTKSGNKGSEAAASAIEMVNIYRQLN